MTDLQIARSHCTEKEYAAYELHYRRMSERAIALALNLSRSAVRARLENARRKIDQARKEQAA